jgi:hypothetical protein
MEYCATGQENGNPIDRNGLQWGQSTGISLRTEERLLSEDLSQGMVAKSGHALAKAFENRRRARRRRKLVLVQML